VDYLGEKSGVGERGRAMDRWRLQCRGPRVTRGEGARSWVSMGGGISIVG